MVDRYGNIGEAITPQSVALVVKRAAEVAGLDQAKYCGHSLRAGFMKQGAISGASETNIMCQTGHKSHDTVRGYIRIANIFKDNVTGLKSVYRRQTRLHQVDHYHCESISDAEPR